MVKNDIAALHALIGVAKSITPHGIVTKAEATTSGLLTPLFEYLDILDSVVANPTTDPALKTELELTKLLIVTDLVSYLAPSMQ